FREELVGRNKINFVHQNENKMSLQWTFIATFLYIEIAIVLLLLLPFISAATWQKLFKSRIFAAVTTYANWYFNIFIVVLLILFADAVRDIRRFDSTLEEKIDLKNNPQAETMLQMRMFRAQRNLYIVGFALLLFVVLRRLVTLISQQASLAASEEAAIKQAKSASDAAQKLMEENAQKKKETGDNEKNESRPDDKLIKELEVTKKDLEDVKEELHRANLDLATMKKQAESTNEEYDRLLKELTAVQSQVASGDKKDD
ncbi:unnamed protein product, partial [Owenia fusiformis]